MVSQSIPQWFLDDLLNRIDLIEILSQRIRLKKSGNNFVGLCPFHQEKTPSFSAHPTKQFYYCFGCGASGNAINFLMQYERLTFPEAVENLAHQAGLTLPQASQQKNDRSNTLYACLEKACKHYEHQLKQTPKAIEYLKARGLTGTTAKRFRLGYAPSQWQFIFNKLSHQGQHKKMLLESGLVNAKHERYYDRFRDRIMFPIRNTQGKTIGFGGRSLDGSEPKYLNSPETSIFHKKYELYGLYEAKSHHTQLDPLLVVEGYMDVLSLAQHGITNVVGTLGTAITAQHVQKMLRYSHTIIFCFDGDEAGRTAAWRALETTLPVMRDDLHVGFLFFEAGHDPDSFVRQYGPQTFNDHLHHALPLADFFFRELQQDLNLNRLEDRARFAQKVLRYLSNMPQGVYQHLLYEKLSQLIQIPIDNIQQFIQTRTQKTNQKPPAPKKHLDLYKRTLAILLQNPQFAKEISPDQLDFEPFSNVTQLLRETIQFFQQQTQATTANLLHHYEHSKAKDDLAYLSSVSLPTPEAGLLQEFIAGIERIHEHALETQITHLLKKHQQQGLSENEKRHLQELLNKKSTQHGQLFS